MYGDVTFKLSGSSYTVRYPNAVWDDLKATFDVASEAECTRQAEARAGLLVILGAGLATHHPGLTPAAVEEIHVETPAVDESSLSDACYKAIRLALPEPKKKKSAEKVDPKKKPPTPGPHDLRIEAFKAGMTPSEFSAITPRETVMFVDGYVWRQGQARRLAVMTAWHTEAFARTKRLGSLQRVLDKVGRDTSDPAAAAADRAARAQAWFRKLKEK